MSLLTLKRRIKTAQNVSKTTRAMQMIAASKLKRAQNAALSSRPYVEKLTNVTEGISLKLDAEHKPQFMQKIDSIDKTLVILISPDKGLCGGLVTNLARELLDYEKNHKNNVYITIGKKAEQIVARLGKDLKASFPIGATLPPFDVVYPVISMAKEMFTNKDVSSVVVLYTNFNSVFSQNPVINTLLPITLPEPSSDASQTLFEPNPAHLLPDLLSHYIEMNLYQYILEGYLSEQAARMFAMQNATDNAKDIIEELRLEYNKKRQEKITNEILDITGAFAV